MKVRIKKLVPEAVVPAYAHDTDAGLDLVAAWVEVDESKLTSTVGCGLAFEIPEGYVGLVFPRSSVYKKGLMLYNAVGVIDSGYRGEVTAKFIETEFDSEFYKVGERFAQLVIIPYPKVELEEVDELSDSDRGEGGYGSTGK